ncbi:MAG: sulfite exporter TauE/SafE family protein [Longimicrobiales bacterium]
MLPSLGAAALAGLVGSPHCMGMCGGFAVACGGGRRGVAWHAGRLTTYAVLGAVAGGFGAALPGPPWVAAVVSAALLIWFAGALAGLVPEPTLRIPGVSGLAGRAIGKGGFGPGYALGLATGLLPCGLVYAALAIPVASGAPMVGAASMVAFGLGTVPALAAMTVGARRLVFRDLRFRRVLAAGVLVLGLVSVGMRQGLLPRPGMDHGGHAEHDAPDPPTAPVDRAGSGTIHAPADAGR